MAVYLGIQPVNVHTGGQPSISLEEKTISAGTSDIEVIPTDGKYLSKVIVSGDTDLIAENIKEGVDIFGVTGTFAGSTGQYVWAKYEYIPAYLSFIGNEDFTLKTGNTTANWDGVLEYSTDTSTWNTWNGTEISSAGSKLYLRGTGNTIIAGNSSAYIFVFTGTDSLRINCEGNIENLLDYQTVINGEHPVMASGCYAGMFYGCTNLITAPELPATTLAVGCYFSMFRDCTNLTTLPALPATTLADSCYRYMFYGCTNIKLSATQTGEYQTAYRIPTSGTGTTVTNALAGMFANTGGTFTEDPEFNTTYYTSNTVV